MKGYIKIILLYVFIVMALAVMGGLLWQTWWGATLTVVSALLIVKVVKNFKTKSKVKQLRKQLGAEAPILTTEDGYKCRDLNKNGKLDIYEDSRQPIDARVEDLLGQMTIEEKSGLMFSPMMSIGKKGAIHEKRGLITRFGTSDVIIGKNINTFASLSSGSTQEFVKWHNDCQKMAERTRLGIPITLCSDPRHDYRDTDNKLASLLDTSVSMWPQSPGLAATGDEKLVEEFGNIARQEISSIGIRFALHPSADLATEPRWGRINGTFGEDADLTSKMISAYIRGFQGLEIGSESVACCVKHFAGGGPQKDGLDPHFSYGKDQVYPGNNLDYHVKPFKAAFEVGVASVMPYYGRPIGIPNIEEVGFNYNHDITHTLLREKLGYEGIVHTDYRIIHDNKVLGINFIPAKAWGVEHLSYLERCEKAINTGVDQIGGEACPELIVQLVKEDRISEERVNKSCRRILKLKFQLGLFDNPYVDVDKALSICNKSEFVEAGREAMRKSLVLLKNDGYLPLADKPKVYIEGFKKEIVEKYAIIVNKPKDADFALLKLKSPSRRINEYLFDMLFPQGDLDFVPKKKKYLLKIMATVPTIVSIYLERPAVIPELDEHASGIIADFGCNQEIILEALFGKFSPTGKLPFELPRSMEAVRMQKSDVPYDSENPLYTFGHGLTY